MKDIWFIIKDWFYVNRLPLSILALLLLLAILSGCNSERPCNLKYRHQDEINKVFIELDAHNLQDCQPYEHIINNR